MYDSARRNLIRNDRKEGVEVKLLSIKSERNTNL